MDALGEILLAALLLLGGLLCLAAGVGVNRFPEVLSRLHAATKPQILGLLAVVTAVFLSSPSLVTGVWALGIVVFQALTAPMSAHLVGRAAYETRQVGSAFLVVDDLRGTGRRPGRRTTR